MGKHATSGSSSHPLVAAALAQRTGEGGAHRPDREPPVGWPGTPASPGGGGLGWPGDLPAPDERSGQGEAPAPSSERKGGRRSFGQDPAA